MVSRKKLMRLGKKFTAGGLVASLGYLTGCGTISDQQLLGLALGGVAPFSHNPKAGIAADFLGRALVSADNADRSRSQVNIQVSGSNAEQNYQEQYQEPIPAEHRFSIEEPIKLSKTFQKKHKNLNYTLYHSNGREVVDSTIPGPTNTFSQEYEPHKLEEGTYVALWSSQRGGFLDELRFEVYDPSKTNSANKLHNLDNLINEPVYFISTDRNKDLQLYQYIKIMQGERTVIQIDWTNFQPNHNFISCVELIPIQAKNLSTSNLKNIILSKMFINSNYQTNRMHYLTNEFINIPPGEYKLNFQPEYKLPSGEFVRTEGFAHFLEITKNEDTKK